MNENTIIEELRAKVLVLEDEVRQARDSACAQCANTSANHLDRLATILDEEFGMDQVMSMDELLTNLEHELSLRNSRHSEERKVMKSSAFVAIEHIFNLSAALLRKGPMEVSPEILISRTSACTMALAQAIYGRRPPEDPNA